MVCSIDAIRFLIELRYQFVYDSFLSHGRVLKNSYCTMEHFLIGFEVLTAVVMNIAIFWDIVQCNPFMNRCFGVTSPPSSGPDISRVGSQRAASA
jgi:hypothetical protein